MNAKFWNRLFNLSMFLVIVGLLWCLLMVAVTSLSCSGQTTGPTPVVIEGVPPPPAVSGTQNEETSPPTVIDESPSPPIPPGDLECQVWMDDEEYHLRCTNTYPMNEAGPSEPALPFYGVCYARDEGDPTQHQLKVVPRIIAPQETGNAKIQLPECGFLVQCDGTTILPPLTYTWPDKMPGMITGTGRTKKLEPCPEEPKCELTQADCSNGPFLPMFCECGTCPPDTVWNPETLECSPTWCQPKRECVAWAWTSRTGPNCHKICVKWETTETQLWGDFPGIEGCPPSYEGVCDGRSEAVVCE